MRNVFICVVQIMHQCDIMTPTVIGILPTNYFYAL